MSLLVIATICSIVSAGPLKAPPGMFKDLNDTILCNAIIVEGKQLFIDDYIIEKLDRAEKILNQPTKHQNNPLIVPDKPWEPPTFNRGSTIYDEEENIYKMWYVYYDETGLKQRVCYATSLDGIKWDKPIINKKEQSNVIAAIKATNPPCIMKDPTERDPKKRYKMLYGDYEKGSKTAYCTSAAYSPDGIHWTPEPENPLIPHSDTLSCPIWDPQRNRYAAYLRFGPPNRRLIAMTSSEDFIHWSPKITVLNHTKMDDDTGYGYTSLYGMKVMLYEGAYIGLIEAYRGETISPIPKEEEEWRDKTNEQLAFSRDGLIWMRVGPNGAIRDAELSEERNWKQIAKKGAFIPWGRHKVDWDWGGIWSFQQPLVIGDQIKIYYLGQSGRHWASYHGDTVKAGIGLATLRLDGFVSIDAASAGTMTTKLLVFVGDTIELNANAAGGSIRVEALDAEGKVIEGFSREDCQPITTDNVRHILKWKGNDNCQLIQARPIKLKFYMERSRLYSFTPRIRHTHYIPSYD